jgi:hypothetical protein
MFEVTAIPDDVTFFWVSPGNSLDADSSNKHFKISLIKKRLKGSITQGYRSIAQLVIVLARGQIISLRTLSVPAAYEQQSTHTKRSHTMHALLL